MRPLLLTCLLCGCSVGDRYLIAEGTLAQVNALDLAQRARTAAPVHRISNGQAADVRASTLSLGEAKPRTDGQVAIPTRTFSKRVQIGNILVWVGTPPSLAGLGMVIFGHGAVRWSGIALALAAEPVMITGTVLWVKGSNAHPQELPRALADVTYLPPPSMPVSFH